MYLHIPTYRRIHSLSLYLGFSLFFLACSDPVALKGTSSSPSQTKYNYGESSKIYYECATATNVGNQTKWTYHVKEIMNLMSAVQVTITKSQQTPSGPARENWNLLLQKQTTDTFANSNLTVQLKQMGARKSMEVNHHSAGIFARAENGWCTQSSKLGQVGPTNDPYERDSERWTGTLQDHQSVHGLWTPDPSFFQASEGTLGAHQLWINLNPSSEDREVGWIRYRSKCKALLDLGMDTYMQTGSNRRTRLSQAEGYRQPTGRLGKRGFLFLMLDIIDFLVNVYEVHRCHTNPETMVEKVVSVTWTMNDPRGILGISDIPRWFIDACASRQGINPLYAMVGLYQGDGYLCMTHWDEKAGQRKRSIEILSSGLSREEMGTWMRFNYVGNSLD